MRIFWCNYFSYTTVTADNMTDVTFTNCALFSTSHEETNEFLNKTVVVNLSQKVLNQIYEIILTHFFHL